MQRIQGKMRKILDRFAMIEDGDKIAIGLSGGKDSLVLLTALANMRNYYPKKYEVVAITVDMHNGESDFIAITNYCKELKVEHKIVATQIYDILFNIRKEKNPCSLCARMRRGILSDTAKELGCNKLALGHHADDLIETFLLSLFYESRLSTFAPVTNLDRVGIIVIRPMLLVWEKETIKSAKTMPIFHNDCPANKFTQREYIKQMLINLGMNIKDVREHILGALMNPERNNLINIDNSPRDDYFKLNNDK